MNQTNIYKSLLILIAMIPFIGAAQLDELAEEQLKTTKKFSEVYRYVDNLYLEDIDGPKLTETAIRAMLEELDPHSVYISAEEVESANRNIVGSFVGVGIRFQILKDTLMVVNPIPGGPSAKVGVRAGDKIIKIDDEVVAGVGLKNSGVRDRLLGDKGSKVILSIYRKGTKKLVEYEIKRDKIPVFSVPTSYMIDNEIGYIKLTSFSRTSYDEVHEAIEKLKGEGMKKLVFDLQDNGGGLLYASKQIADEFLDDDRMIVYSEGRAQPKKTYVADKKGIFEKGQVIFLIDESTASASEILSGAIQDWDRGVIIGRRSFGKGLVQRPIDLSDGSQIRLTIARYFTPSGRWIQKPYEDHDAYRNDYMTRFESGELMSKDSIQLPDSLKYQTLVNKREIYGGGGIVPDIFVPIDTTQVSEMYKDILRKGVINGFSIEYVDQNRKALAEKYPTFEDFKKATEISEIIEAFWKRVEEEGVEIVDEDLKISGKLIELRVKASIANDLWDFGKYYEIVNVENDVLSKAIEVFKTKGAYEKILKN
ncbi:MAG: S41 family peptidase [Crocinitomicaceae bacterium]|nr:S41 family peptidase [Crocinitomicaceae bacterium]